MSRCTEVKSINPKLTQKQIAEDLVYFDSTLKRYRNDRKMQSPYESAEMQNGFKRIQKTSMNLPNNQRRFLPKP